MKLSEAEIQLLASIEEANSNGVDASRTTLVERSDRYWVYKENWANAYDGLIDKGLIIDTDHIYQLTDSGRPLATKYFAQRPDLMWTPRCQQNKCFHLN